MDYRTIEKNSDYELEKKKKTFEEIIKEQFNIENTKKKTESNKKKIYDKNLINNNNDIVNSNSKRNTHTKDFNIENCSITNTIYFGSSECDSIHLNEEENSIQYENLYDYNNNRNNNIHQQESPLINEDKTVQYKNLYDYNNNKNNNIHYQESPLINEENTVQYKNLYDYNNNKNNNIHYQESPLTNEENTVKYKNFYYNDKNIDNNIQFQDNDISVKKDNCNKKFYYDNPQSINNNNIPYDYIPKDYYQNNIMKEYDNYYFTNNDINNNQRKYKYEINYIYKENEPIADRKKFEYCNYYTQGEIKENKIEIKDNFYKNCEKEIKYEKDIDTYKTEKTTNMNIINNLNKSIDQKNNNAEIGKTKNDLYNKSSNENNKIKNNNVSENEINNKILNIKEIETNNKINNLIINQINQISNENEMIPEKSNEDLINDFNTNINNNMTLEKENICKDSKLIKELEIKMQGFISEEITLLMNSSKWEDRKNGFHKLNELIKKSKFYCVTLLKNNFENILAYIKMILRDFKENNFNILREAFNCYAELTIILGIEKIFDKKICSTIIKEIWEKLSDTKLKESLINLIYIFMEYFSPIFVINNLIKNLEKTKSVNLLKEYSSFFEKSIEEFGISNIPIKEIVNYCKILANNSNHQVRYASTNLLCFLFKFIGNDLKILINKDIKESTYKAIEAELDKVSVFQGNDINLHSQGKRQIKDIELLEQQQKGIFANSLEKQNEKNKNSNNNKFNFQNLICPQDISKKITPKIIKDINEGKWPEKKEAFESLEKILNEANMKILANGIPDLFLHTLKPKFSDGNKQLVRIAIQFFTKLIVALGPYFKSMQNNIFKNMAFSLIPNLSDKMQLVREDVLACLEKWILIGGVDSIIMSIQDCLNKNENFEVRKDLLKFLIKHMNLISESTNNSNIFKEFVSPIVKCLMDKVNLIRNMGEEFLEFSLSSISINLYYDNIKDFKPAIKDTLKNIFDKYNNYNINYLSNANTLNNSINNLKFTFKNFIAKNQNMSFNELGDNSKNNNIVELINEDNSNNKELNKIVIEDNFNYGANQIYKMNVKTNNFKKIDQKNFLNKKKNENSSDNGHFIINTKKYIKMNSYDNNDKNISENLLPEKKTNMSKACKNSINNKKTISKENSKSNIRSLSKKGASESIINSNYQRKISRDDSLNSNDIHDYILTKRKFSNKIGIIKKINNINNSLNNKINLRRNTINIDKQNSNCDSSKMKVERDFRSLSKTIFNMNNKNNNKSKIRINLKNIRKNEILIENSGCNITNSFFNNIKKMNNFIKKNSDLSDDVEEIEDSNININNNQRKNLNEFLNNNSNKNNNFNSINGISNKSNKINSLHSSTKMKNKINSKTIPVNISTDNINNYNDINYNEKERVKSEIKKISLYSRNSFNNTKNLRMSSTNFKQNQNYFKRLNQENDETQKKQFIENYSLEKIHKHNKNLSNKKKALVENRNKLNFTILDYQNNNNIECRNSLCFLNSDDNNKFSINTNGNINENNSAITTPDNKSLKNTIYDYKLNLSEINLGNNKKKYSGNLITKENENSSEIFNSSINIKTTKEKRNEMEKREKLNMEFYISEDQLVKLKDNLRLIFQEEIYCNLTSEDQNKNLNTLIYIINKINENLKIHQNIIEIDIDDYNKISDLTKMFEILDIFLKWIYWKFGTSQNPIFIKGVLQFFLFLSDKLSLYSYEENNLQLNEIESGIILYYLLNNQCVANLKTKTLVKNLLLKFCGSVISLSKSFSIILNYLTSSNKNHKLCCEAIEILNKISQMFGFAEFSPKEIKLLIKLFLCINNNTINIDSIFKSKINAFLKNLALENTECFLSVVSEFDINTKKILLEKIQVDNKNSKKNTLTHKTFNKNSESLNVNTQISNNLREERNSIVNNAESDNEMYVQTCFNKKGSEIISLENSRKNSKNESNKNCLNKILNKTNNTNNLISYDVNINRKQNEIKNDDSQFSNTKINLKLKSNLFNKIKKNIITRKKTGNDETQNNKDKNPNYQSIDNPNLMFIYKDNDTDKQTNLNKMKNSNSVREINKPSFKNKNNDKTNNNFIESSKKKNSDFFMNEILNTNFDEKTKDSPNFYKQGLFTFKKDHANDIDDIKLNDSINSNNKEKKFTKIKFSSEFSHCSPNKLSFTNASNKNFQIKGSINSLKNTNNSNTITNSLNTINTNLLSSSELNFSELKNNYIENTKATSLYKPFDDEDKSILTILEKIDVSNYNQTLESLVTLLDIIANKYESCKLNLISHIDNIFLKFINLLGETIEDINVNSIEKLTHYKINITKYLLTIIYRISSKKELINYTLFHNISQLFEILMQGLLLNNSNEKSTNHEQILIIGYSINSIVFKLLENYDYTKNFEILFDLIFKFRKIDDKSKFVCLSMKCILKLVQISEKIINEIKLHHIFYKIHLIIIQIQQEQPELKTDNKLDLITIKFLKNVIFEFSKIKKDLIISDYIKFIENIETKDIFIKVWIKEYMNDNNVRASSAEKGDNLILNENEDIFHNKNTYFSIKDCFSNTICDNIIIDNNKNNLIRKNLKKEDFINSINNLTIENRFSINNQSSILRISSRDNNLLQKDEISVEKINIKNFNKNMDNNNKNDFSDSFLNIDINHPIKLSSECQENTISAIVSNDNNPFQVIRYYFYIYLFKQYFFNCQNIIFINKEFYIKLN